MASRLELQDTLETILESRNVYFNPPESIKMNYPAIIYKLDDTFLAHIDEYIELLKKNFS